MKYSNSIIIIFKFILKIFSLEGFFHIRLVHHYKNFQNLCENKEILLTIHNLYAQI